MALEESIWARPEDMTQLRPTSTVSPTAPGSDLTGATVAALAATSVALKSQAYGSSVTALTTALTLYPIMRANEGLWSDAYDDASAVSVLQMCRHCIEQLVCYAPWSSVWETGDEPGLS